jgi:hypothetical protein
LEEIENGFNFLFSFMAKSKKSPVGAVVVLMLSGGETEVVSSVLSVNPVASYLLGRTLLFHPLIVLSGLRNGY